jgi:hypothetical protein
MAVNVGGGREHYWAFNPQKIVHVNFCLLKVKECGIKSREFGLPNSLVRQFEQKLTTKSIN